ncbi:hypothetical protein [Tateyamaria pelophila]|uniref:hypothetical protein n=1 Tax=Tateyamaria pelophila TaxID=328415 RepID=UPI001CBFD0F0|nr:hypothetical protein [Tateyamaria pelophila]
MTIYTINQFESKAKANTISYDLKAIAVKDSAFSALVDTVYIECGLERLITTKKGGKAYESAVERYKKCLNSVLWNLYTANGSYLRISMDFHTYSKGGHNPHSITKDITKIVKQLEDTGFIYHQKFTYDPKTKRGKRSRILAQGPLLEAFTALPEDLSEAPVPVPAIQFRTPDDKGNYKPVDYPLNDWLQGQADIIRKYNSFIRTQDITIAGEHTFSWVDAVGTVNTVSTARTGATAIFHVSEDQISYGRVHGGFHQRIPSKFRPEILINGEPTVELDYSAQVISIIAGMEGIELSDEDPYDIPLQGICKFYCRDLLKNLIVVMVNSKSKDQAFSASLSWCNSEGVFRGVNGCHNQAFFDYAVDQIFTKHRFLKSHAFQAESVFMEDSDIARKIIGTCTNSDIAILPIHDGFICKEEDEKFLHSTMQTAWSEKFPNTKIGIKKE